MTAPFPKLPLHTARLTLRDFAETDFASVHAYGADSEVVRFMNWGPNDEAATRDFLARTVATTREEPRTNWELAMILSETGEQIGGCGLMPRRMPCREWELGYVLRRDHWGQGFVPEAARAVVDFGFRTLDAHRIYARIDPENHGSVRVAERLSMRFEGTFRRDEWIQGEWRDTSVYALLDEDWAPARG